MKVKTDGVEPDVQAGMNVKDRVAAALESLRPMIQWDGGDVELVDITPEGVVSVRFHGACVGCPSSQATLRFGIEQNLRQQVPEITQVVSMDA